MTIILIKLNFFFLGHLGEIMSMIEDEGYSITGLQMFYIDNVNAEEFFEVYRGVLQEYPVSITSIYNFICIIF